MKFIKGFFHFWYDFIIGDDWKIAASVLIPLIIGAVLVINGIESLIFPPLLALAVAASFIAALAIDIKQHP